MKDLQRILANKQDVAVLVLDPVTEKEVRVQRNGRALSVL